MILIDSASGVTESQSLVFLFRLDEILSIEPGWGVDVNGFIVRVSECGFEDERFIVCEGGGASLSEVRSNAMSG